MNILDIDFCITKENLSNKVFDIIKNMVLEERWKVGEKIPSEIALSKMFGVSRLTIRVALDKLNTLGLLETKVGKGTYVKRFDFSKYFDRLYDLYPSNDALLNDVYEFRKTIEIRCFELIVEGNESLDMSYLHDLDTQMNNIEFSNGHPNLQGLITEHTQLDFAFHLEICRLSKNELLFLAYQMAKLPITSYLYRLMLKRVAEVSSLKHDEPFYLGVSLEEIHGNHREIITCLENKDIGGYQRIYNQINNYRFNVLDTSNNKI